MSFQVAEWVKVVVATVLGFASAYLLEMLKSNRTERRKREKMRKALYVELTQHYHSIRNLIGQLGKSLSLIEDHAFDVKAILTILGRADKFEDVESVAGSPTFRVVLGRLLRLVSLDSYKYAKSNPDIFYELPEAFSIDAIYSHLQLIISRVESTDVRHTLEEAKSFLDFVDHAVKVGALSEDMFKAVAAPLYAKMGLPPG
jgi:hypothetical protein